jgi:rare lipoprotein A
LRRFDIMFAKPLDVPRKHGAGHALVGLTLLPALVISACAARSASAVPVVEKPRQVLEVKQGLASYYGPGFDGKRTASGVTFDQNEMLAAHPTYPFGTVVRVTNLSNQRQVVVRVVDRGPAKGPRAEGVVIDVSSGAAKDLGFIRKGRTRVRLEVLRWGGVNSDVQATVVPAARR